MPRLWIAISHTHAFWRNPADKDQILDAIGDDGQLVKVIQIHDPGPVDSMAKVDWREAQIRQAEAWQRQEEMVKDNPALGRAYFGATTIPHALDLGARLRTFDTLQVFQQHHTERDEGQYHWRWTGRPAGQPAPRVCVTGLPTGPDPRAGEAVIRVSASYTIQPEQTESVVPNPLVAVDIRVDPIALDPFATPEELEQVFVAFHDALKRLEATYKDRLRRIHLFVAGPVGLCFRLGGAINPTIYPPVQSWQYVASHTPCYLPAMVIGRSLKELKMRAKILFLAAEPQRPNDAAARLHLDVEQRRIVARLESGTHRDQLELETRLAVEARELQRHLDRSEAVAIHFSGHGDKDGHLLVEGEGGRARELPVEAVIRVFRIYNERRHLRLVVLNACWSAELAQRLAEEAHIPCVIGMLQAVGDDAAVVFAEELYSALADRKSVRVAFDRAVTQLMVVGTHKRSEHIPQLCHTSNPEQVFLIDP